MKNRKLSGGNFKPTHHGHLQAKAVEGLACRRTASFVVEVEDEFVHAEADVMDGDVQDAALASGSSSGSATTTTSSSGSGSSGGSSSSSGHSSSSSSDSSSRNSHIEYSCTNSGSESNHSFKNVILLADKISTLKTWPEP